MQEPIQNAYSKVIFRNFDDLKAKRMVNSYRFKSSSPNRYRVWSPELAREERFKRKRNREEEYIQEFNEPDRPILLIHKKHQYQGQKKNNVFNKPEDNFFKISENTKVIEDVQDQIYSQSGHTQRQTLFHGKQRKNNNQEDAVYKVEGIEFLPEGFLELDPLQYADEYEFQNNLHKKYFNEDQRRIKALRRKQYAQKNFQKMRDVTIFLVDERRDKIIDYLEKWYLKNKRRMNQEELNYIADLLKCDRQTMKDLQDMFLERKKHLNRSHLKSYLAQHGKIKDGKFIIPPSLKSYFKKKNDPYSHIQSRYLGYKDDNKNRPKNKALKVPFGDRVRASSMSNLHYRPSRSQTMHRKGQKSGLNKTYTQFKKGKGFTNSESFNELIKKNQARNVKGGQYDNYRNDNNDDLARYFDSEVNKILDRIEGHEVKQERNCDMEIPDEKRFMNCDRVLDNNQNKQYIESYKKHFNVSDKMRNIKKSNPKSSKKMSEKDKREAEELLNQTNEEHLKNQEPRYKYQFNPYINKKKKKISTDLQMKNINIQQDFFKQKQKLRSSLVVNRKPTEKLEPERSLTVTPLDVIKNEEQNENIERVTIVSKNENRPETLITQKLTPQCIANEYYYQLIEDIVNDKGERKVTLITKSERGEVINKIVIPESLVGDNYHNKVVRQVSELDGKQESLLIVYNDKNKPVNIAPIRTNVKTLFGRQNIEKRMGSTNQRNSVVVEMDLERGHGVKRIHSLPPFMIFGKKFQQKVIEVEPRNKKKTVQLLTLDDKGKVIHSEKLKNASGSKMFYSQIENDFVDKEGIRHLTLKTKNQNGKILTSHNFQKMQNQIIPSRTQTLLAQKPKFARNPVQRTYSLNPVILGNDFIYQDVKEFKDKYGKKRSKLITKDQNGEKINEVILKGTNNGQRFYSEIIDEKRQMDGKRQYTIATKNERGETVALNQLRPLFNSILGEDMMVNFSKRASKRSSFRHSQVKNQQSKSSIIIQPVLIGNIYYQQILEEALNEYNEKEYVLNTFDQMGNLKSQQQIEEGLVEGDEFATEVGEEHVDENGIRKVTIRTLNKDNQVIAEQEVEAKSFSIFTESLLNRFFNQNNDVISNQTRTKSTTVNTKQFKPTLIAGEQYQKLIQEILDEEGQKELCVITKNSKGSLIDVKRVDPDFNQKNIHTRKSKRGISIVVTNSQGEEINNLKVSVSNFKYQKHFEKTHISCKEVSEDENGRERFVHYLKPTVFGNSTYQQIVEEYFNGESYEQKVTTINHKNETVDESVLEEYIPSENFKTLQSNEHINDEGYRKVILETVNEKDQILHKIELEFKTNEHQEILFDDVNIQELDTNEVMEEEKDGQTIRKHILRPTIIGNDYYQHIIEEVFDEFKNKKTSTLYVYNQEGQEMDKVALNLDIESENYQVEVSKETINKAGERIATVSVLNEKNEILAQVQQETEIATNISEYFYTDFIDIFDDQHKRQSVISIKSSRHSTFRTHSLRPTLIGGNYYQQIVNEVLYEHYPERNRATIVTCDENGAIVSVQEISPDQMGDHYYNTKQDKVSKKNKERSISLNLFNNKGQIISQQQIKPRVVSMDRRKFDHNLVEVIDRQNNQEVYVVDKQKNLEKILKKTIMKSKLKSILVPIEESFTENQQGSFKNRNGYFDDLVELYKIKKNPNRFTQVQVEQRFSNNRHKTFNAKDIERPKKAKPQNLTTRKFKSKTMLLNNKNVKRRKNQTLTGSKTSKVKENVIQELNEDKEKIDEQFIEKFTDRKQLGKNEIELYEYQRKQTELLQKMKLIQNPEVEIVEKIRKQTELLQKFQKKKTNPERRKTLSMQIKDEIEELQLKNQSQDVIEEKLRSHTEIVNELLEVYNNDEDILAQIRRQTQILKQLNKENKQTPVHFEKIRKSTILLQQLKKLNLNNVEIKEHIRKQTEYLQTLKNFRHNSQIVEVKQLRKPTEIIPQKKEFKQNDVEMNEIIKKKTIQLQNMVQNMGTIESIEDVRRLTQEIHELKKEESERSVKQNFQSFKESARDINEEESQNVKTQFLDQTQDNSYIQQRPYSVQEEYQGDQKDFLIEKSEKLKGYLDDYINTLKQEKQREQIEKELKKQQQEQQQQQEGTLRKTIEEVFKKEVDKLSDDIVAKINQKLHQTQNAESPSQNQNLLDEFYEFCQQTLPEDSNYKESIMFVSLFYYFMEKKKLLK